MVLKKAEGWKYLFLTSAWPSLCIPTPHRVPFPFPRLMGRCRHRKCPVLPAVPAVLTCMQHRRWHSHLRACTGTTRSAHALCPRVPAGLPLVLVPTLGWLLLAFISPWVGSTVLAAAPEKLGNKGPSLEVVSEESGSRAERAVWLFQV